MSGSVQPSWLKVQKTADLFVLVIIAQALLRAWFFDPTLIPGFAGKALFFLIFSFTAFELWSLQVRRRFGAHAALIPLAGFVGVCASVWIIGPSMYSWVLAVSFVIFTRMPVRFATLASGLAIIVSVWIMAWRWDLGAAIQVRAALSGFFIVVMLNLFFQANETILADLAQTRDHLDDALQNMSQGICVVGKDGHFKMFNNKLCELLDLPHALVERKPLLSEVVKFQSDRGDFGPEFSGVEASARGCAGSFGVDKDGNSPRHYLCRDRNGRYIEVHSRSTPSGDMVRTLSDVTKYEEVNRQLKVVLDEYQELSEQATQRGHNQIVTALTELSVIRDSETGQHIKRTELYVKLLAQSLLDSGRYMELLSAQQIDLIVKATPMHDLGKIGIPDHILLKPGRHTEEETQFMRTHAALGESILLVMAGVEKSDDSLFTVAAKLAGAHHENWDGSGYPRGLSGLDIPLVARLMALADVYDALTTARVYKAAWTHQETSAHILSLSGAKFDPSVVAAFEREEANFSTIARELADH